MASKYGNNYKAKYITVPETKIPVGEQRGVVRVAYDKFDMATDGLGVTTSDTIYMQKIPAGARVIDAWLKFADMGTSGVVDIGWQASADGVETADADGIFSAIDVQAAADCLLASQDDASPLVVNREFSSEVGVVMVFSTLTTATTGTIELTIQYVID